MKGLSYVYVHPSVETIVNDELMRHLYSEGLHRMFLPVVKAAHLVVVKVRYSFLRHKDRRLNSILIMDGQ